MEIVEQIAERDEAQGARSGGTRAYGVYVRILSTAQRSDSLEQAFVQ